MVLVTDLAVRLDEALVLNGVNEVRDADTVAFAPELALEVAVRDLRRTEDEIVLKVLKELSSPKFRDEDAVTLENWVSARRATSQKTGSCLSGEVVTSHKLPLLGIKKAPKGL
ncbi:hypothetical protein [Streptomyces hundungensis]|uniref:hypothetical protein n=1 Tax=Streptomyces hundungensis TaxID=1077946 RepID=UPI0031EB0342